MTGTTFARRPRATRPRRGSARRIRTAAWWSLVVVSGFNALSALVGGIGMVAADGLSMPKSMLADTPFSTFAVPGLILALVVGGTQAVAAWSLVARRESALLWSAVAGFGMVIWIVTEVGFIHALMYAQTIYLVTGLLQLILVFSLLGIVSWLPRLDRTHGERRQRRANLTPGGRHIPHQFTPIKELP